MNRKLKIKILRNGTQRISTLPGFNRTQSEGLCHFTNQHSVEKFRKFTKIEDRDKDKLIIKPSTICMSINYKSLNCYLY